MIMEPFCEHCGHSYHHHRGLNCAICATGQKQCAQYQPAPPAPVADVEARHGSFDQWLTEQMEFSASIDLELVQREFRRRFEITEGK